MRCVEAQELLAQGKSRLYFNAPRHDSLSPFADEVDGHIENCPECGNELIRLLRKQLIRRPGLRHWVQVRRAIRAENASLARAKSGYKNWEAPIIRVANTVIQQAINRGADQIEMAMTMERPPNLSMQFESRNDPVLIVKYHVGIEWELYTMMPEYIRPPLFARLKSMADMLLTVEDEPQQGQVPIRYENQNYSVNIRTTPSQLSERLLLEIRPA